MEKRAGVKGGVVTMHVLFDMAVRSGHYDLAETFLKEMGARKLKFHRHFRVSIIYYYGVMRDGDAVRRAYHDLVSAGDIVDTVVMNAVIAALFRAGEPAAAEHVFERMKRLNATKSNPRHIPRNWRERRLLGLQLTHDVKNLPIEDTDKRKMLQEQAPIAPDSRTYGLLIRHHSATAGNVDRVLELLREMELNQVPIEGTIFIVILYGFNSYGGVRYSSWTGDKLEDVWLQYIKSVQESIPRTWFSSMSVIVALKAFSKCTGAERTLQAWEEVRRVWEPEPEELQQVLKVLRRLVPEHSFFNANV
jgi:pentatricopeptide repeat protein